MVVLKIYFIFLTIFTFLCFGYDKGLARKNKWRVPERNLFIIVLLGGTIGGLLGMHTFRHKTNKTSFILMVYAILIVQLGLLYVWARYF